MGRRYQAGDQTLVREINLATVLRYLRESGPLSRARLADLTGLNKTTVSSLVETLLEARLVHAVGLNASGSGRPATLLDLNPDAGYIIGLALGVDFILAVLTDLTGHVHWRRLLETDPAESQEVVLAQALSLVDEAQVASETYSAHLFGLGLATPGTVNVDEGVLISSPNLQWRNVPFRQVFHDHTGLPVFVDNDANAGALAEHLFGVAQKAHDFIFIFAGVGVGGGLFLRGELYRGAWGFAGEIGHTNFMMEQYRTPCRCGNRGCWETFVNQYSIVERVRARLAARRNSLLSQFQADPHTSLTVPIIIQAADAGDVEAIEALQEAGAAMGLGIASLVNIFNPEMVVLGGTLSAADQYLLPPIQDAVQRTCLPEIGQNVEILLSAFGPDASVIGAAALVIETILSHPGSVERLSRSAQRRTERHRGSS